jgi:urease accessory protein
MKRSLQLGLILICFIPTAALAHADIGSTTGFSHGFTHPLSGLDHQLAMVLVGILAVQLGGRAIWLLPLTFLSLMAVGGTFGIMGMPLQFIEAGIALSVICLGVAVACRVKLPIILAVGLVGLFAIFHGHAHGSEMPVDVSGLEYGIGFLLATASLHTIGLGIGFVIRSVSEKFGTNLSRVTGGLAAVVGFSLLLNWI